MLLAPQRATTRFIAVAVKKRRAPADRTAAQRVARNKSTYARAGLVRIDTWVPPDDAPEILQQCQKLRDIYLGRARE